MDNKVGTDGPTGLPAAQELADALRLVLPLAKGYAHAHQVGGNQSYVNHAEEILERWYVEEKALDDYWRRRRYGIDWGTDEYLASAGLAAPQPATLASVASTPSKYCEYCGTPKDYFQHPDPCHRAPASTPSTPSLVEENKRLREALIELNAALDEFWNDPFRSASNHFDRHATALCAAQQKCERALRNGEPG